MATYDYRCRECDSAFEVRRSVMDQPDDISCPRGHGDVARVWSAVAVVGAGAAGARASSAAPAAAPAATGGGCCGGGCCN